MNAAQLEKIEQGSGIGINCFILFEGDSETTGETAEYLNSQPSVTNVSVLDFPELADTIRLLQSETPNCHILICDELGENILDHLTIVDGAEYDGLIYEVIKLSEEMEANGLNLFVSSELDLLSN